MAWPYSELFAQCTRLTQTASSSRSGGCGVVLVALAFTHDPSGLALFARLARALPSDDPAATRRHVLLLMMMQMMMMQMLLLLLLLMTMMQMLLLLLMMMQMMMMMMMMMQMLMLLLLVHIFTHVSFCLLEPLVLVVVVVFLVVVVVILDYVLVLVYDDLRAWNGTDVLRPNKP